ncbi:phage terminase small subunit P27 family [Paracraurococcus lichenis]|uniref:Phage terminase small subunit P27 family n=1 Tax=Paracraurococcus lichenis TaxID=3064888 RepID=A0ABT9E718_9PROT|nr:phage terminase small subunit P27 family [Paracraurococcus sp. LOR1-02]MDO9711981.1 phage terminase small subunit P27 family [Paracraurococcus sp. LOR1-02]
MAGRPRKPTEIKVVTGTLQNYRANPNEPKPDRLVPMMPQHMSPHARAAWPYVCEVLDNMGVLTMADGIALEGLCEAYGDMRRGREALTRLGSDTYETVGKDGNAMRRAYPEVAMVQDADRRLQSWLSKFGLTPADRSRVSARAAQTDNPFAEL